MVPIPNLYTALFLTVVYPNQGRFSARCEGRFQRLASLPLLGEIRKWRRSQPETPLGQALGAKNGKRPKLAIPAELRPLTSLEAPAQVSGYFGFTA
jgi:hypothetical protein